LTDRTGGDIDATNSEQLFLPGFIPALFFLYSFAVPEDIATEGDVVFTGSVCQYAVVTYPDKPIRQDMEKKPSDKLACLEHHDFFAVSICIITP
jgi:hypothetical protein